MKEIERKTIPIKLREIRSNPYRDFSIYPISEEKVITLIESINSTGYWEGLIGRETTDGKVEICYGHHRLEALKRVYGDDYEINIIVQQLSDSEMLKRMSKENDEAFNCPIAAIDDSVNSTIAYLESHPDEARAFLTSAFPEAKRFRIGAPYIAKYLGMSVDKIEKSIERLKLIENGTIDREALYKFPSATSADNFATAVRQFGIKKSDQNAIVEQIRSEGRYGEKSIKDVVMKYHPKNIIKKEDVNDSDYCELRLKSAIALIKKTVRELHGFCDGFESTVFFGGQTTREDINENTLNAYNKAINELAELLKEVGNKIDSRNISAKNK